MKELYVPIQKKIVLNSKQFFVGIAVILFFTLVLFLPSLQNGFTNWDDDKYILQSTAVSHFTFKDAFSTFSVGLYTPITNLSYHLDFLMFGYQPWGFHLSSLILHLLITSLVIVFIDKLSGNKVQALLVGILFAIHPTHVEAICWASSRKDLLYALFSLLSLIQFVRWQNSRLKKNYLLTILFMILACLSKPTALGLPLVFLGLEYIKNKTITWKNIKELIPYLVISLLFFIVGIYGIKTLNIKINPETGYDPWQVICMSSYGFVFYFYKAILPIRLSNFHVYPFPGKAIQFEYLIAPFLLTLIIILFLRYRRNINGLNIGLILFLTLLLPTYRIYPAGYPIVAERYFYLSSVGIFYLIAALIENHIYTKTQILNFATVAITSLILAIMCFTTYYRTKVWKDSNVLWSNTIKTYPEFYYPYSERGKYFLSIGNKQRAVSDFQKSLSLQPDNKDLLNLTSTLLMETGDLVNAKKYIDETLKKDSTNFVFYYNRANILKAEGKHAEAIEEYNVCIKINPVLAEAYNNRGVSYIFVGDTLKAFDDFKKACFLNPGNSMFADNFKRVKEFLK